jgi:hypothetical protein
MPFYTAEFSLESPCYLNYSKLAVYFVECSGLPPHSQDCILTSDSGKSSLPFLIGGTGRDRRMMHINL